ncbi:hypothetical protein ABVN80_14770 [Acinetobacter baumannii]
MNKLASGSVDALIGTTILDVGVDVPAVGMIILAGGGKAVKLHCVNVLVAVCVRRRLVQMWRSLSTLQTIGIHIPKNMLRSDARLFLHTKGFGENIVNDFNFEQLGFTRLSA